MRQGPVGLAQSHVPQTLPGMQFGPRPRSAEADFPSGTSPLYFPHCSRLNLLRLIKNLFLSLSRFMAYQHLFKQHANFKTNTKNNKMVSPPPRHGLFIIPTYPLPGCIFATFYIKWRHLLRACVWMVPLHRLLSDALLYSRLLTGKYLMGQSSESWKVPCLGRSMVWTSLRKEDTL